MRGKSMNRLVWAGGFTNDKGAHCNKEPYKKTCDRCSKQVWMSPDTKGWRVLNTDGTKHLCAAKAKTSRKKKVAGVNEVKRNCKFCGVPIVMIQLSGTGVKRYKAFDLYPEKAPHKCERYIRSAFQREARA